MPTSNCSRGQKSSWPQNCSPTYQLLFDPSGNRLFGEGLADVLVLNENYLLKRHTRQLDQTAVDKVGPPKATCPGSKPAAVMGTMEQREALPLRLGLDLPRRTNPRVINRTTGRTSPPRPISRSPSGTNTHHSAGGEAVSHKVGR